MKITLLATLALGLLSGGASFTAIAEPAAPAPQHMAIVPYDPKKPVAERSPEHLYVPYEEFMTLWQAAKEHRRGEGAPEPASVAYTFTAARYDGKVGERSVTFTARLDLLTGGSEAWQKIRLPFKGAKLTGVQMDGKPAALQGEDLMVEKPGRHRIEATFDVPLAAGAAGFRWGVPRSAATLVTLRLPSAGMTAAIAPEAVRWSASWMAARKSPQRSEPPMRCASP